MAGELGFSVASAVRITPGPPWLILVSTPVRRVKLFALSRQPPLIMGAAFGTRHTTASPRYAPTSRPYLNEKVPESSSNTLQFGFS